jgi:hypothetical protein
MLGSRANVRQTEATELMVESLSIVLRMLIRPFVAINLLSHCSQFSLEIGDSLVALGHLGLKLRDKLISIRELRTKLFNLGYGIGRIGQSFTVTFLLVQSFHAM